LNRANSIDLENEGMNIVKDFSYDRCVKEVILNRDETTHQRHERLRKREHSSIIICIHVDMIKQKLTSLSLALSLSLFLSPPRLHISTNYKYTQIINIFVCTYPQSLCVYANQPVCLHILLYRYARMCQSILRRKTFSRSFETALVRALQQVQTANALAAQFTGDEVTKTNEQTNKQTHRRTHM
jgi:hypothetical protein